MAKLLRHFGIGSSQKKLPQANSESVQNLPARTDERLDRYSTLTVQDGRDKRSVGEKESMRCQSELAHAEYATQTLPIFDGRKQKSSNRVREGGGSGGSFRDWSLRGSPSFRQPAHSGSMKVKLTTGDKGKGNSSCEGCGNSRLLIQRSATTECIKGLKSNQHQSIQMLSEYSNPFDLRSNTPDTATSASDMGTSELGESSIRESSLDNDYSVPYEIKNIFSLDTSADTTAATGQDNIIDDVSGVVINSLISAIIETNCITSLPAAISAEDIYAKDIHSASSDSIAAVSANTISVDSIVPTLSNMKAPQLKTGTTAVTLTQSSGSQCNTPLVSSVVEAVGMGSSVTDVTFTKSSRIGQNNVEAPTIVSCTDLTRCEIGGLSLQAGMVGPSNSNLFSSVPDANLFIVCDTEDLTNTKINDDVSLCVMYNKCLNDLSLDSNPKLPQMPHVLGRCEPSRQEHMLEEMSSAKSIAVGCENNLQLKGGHETVVERLVQEHRPHSDQALINSLESGFESCSWHDQDINLDKENEFYIVPGNSVGTFSKQNPETCVVGSEIGNILHASVEKLDCLKGSEQIPQGACGKFTVQVTEQLCCTQEPIDLETNTKMLEMPLSASNVQVDVNKLIDSRNDLLSRFEVQDNCEQLSKETLTAETCCDNFKHCSVLSICETSRSSSTSATDSTYTTSSCVTESDFGGAANVPVYADSWKQEFSVQADTIAESEIHLLEESKLLSQSCGINQLRISDQNLSIGSNDANVTDRFCVPQSLSGSSSPSRLSLGSVASGPLKIYMLSPVYSGIDDNDDENYIDIQDDTASEEALPGGRQPPRRTTSVRLGAATPPPGGLCAPITGVSDLTPGHYEEPWDLSVMHRTLNGQLVAPSRKGFSSKGNTCSQCSTTSGGREARCTNVGCVWSHSAQHSQSQVYSRPSPRCKASSTSNEACGGVRRIRGECSGEVGAGRPADSRPTQDYDVPWDTRALEIKKEFALRGNERRGREVDGVRCGGKDERVEGRKERRHAGQLVDCNKDNDHMRRGAIEAWGGGWGRNEPIDCHPAVCDRVSRAVMRGGEMNGRGREGGITRAMAQSSCDGGLLGERDAGLVPPVHTNSLRSRNYHRPTPSKLESAHSLDYNPCPAFCPCKSEEASSRPCCDHFDLPVPLHTCLPSNLINHIDPRIPLEQQNWYHGAIGRLDAEKVLYAQREGSFLVRNSESNRRDFSLSVKSARGFMHMKIVANGYGRYILGQFSQPFYNIPQMVYHYMIHQLPIKGAEHMSLVFPIRNELL